MDRGNSTYSNFADTGQWKLVLSISGNEISAFLKNLTEPKALPLLLFRNLRSDKETELLQFVESAVYDNPRILDDFATQIVITSPRALWIPADFVDEDEFDPALYTCVYKVDDEDIFSDSDEEEVCLYSLVPGLKSFINRTLPGCRVTSHLSVLKSLYLKRLSTEDVNHSDSEGFSFFVDVREGFAEIFLFRINTFLCGASHPWKEVSDIAYKIMLMADAYSVKSKEACLNFSGNLTTARNAGLMVQDFFGSILYHQRSLMAEELQISTAVEAALNS